MNEIVPPLEAGPPPAPRKARPLPGTLRLGVTSGFFTIVGFYTGAAAIMGMWAIASDSRGQQTMAFGALALVVARMAGISVSAFMTSRFLDKRSRLGAITAALMLGASLIASFMSTPDFAVPTLAIIGLCLIASVWPYLD